MNAWWWVPISLVAWVAVSVAVGLWLGPVLRRCSQAREAQEAGSAGWRPSFGAPSGCLLVPGMPWPAAAGGFRALAAHILPVSALSAQALAG